MILKKVSHLIIHFIPTIILYCNVLHVSGSFNVALYSKPHRIHEKKLIKITPTISTKSTDEAETIFVM